MAVSLMNEIAVCCSKYLHGTVVGVYIIIRIFYWTIQYI